MDATLEKNIKSLKEKISKHEESIDLVDLERCLREFKTELYIKREQVKKLSTNLEVVTSEAKESKKALDVTRKLLDETNFNLNILSKKFRANEDELFEKIDAFNNVNMKYNTAVVELEKTNELLQKSETERSELSRKMEVMETKERQNFIYHNQILKKETNLKKFLDEVQEVVKKLKLEQSELSELSARTKETLDSQDKIKQLTDTISQLKQEKEHFEELYTKINAKCGMFEQLLKLNENLLESNLTTKIIFNQWKSNRVYYEQSLNDNLDTINKLTDCYNTERETNYLLIEKNDKLTEENQRLKEKLDKFQNQIESVSENVKEKNETCLINNREEIVIKDEIINVD